ncbi:MAG: hypothetical protein P9X24_14515 [Candidatus Hatepunaea meridiana]|nr:hypothetical protein [Candidatus Hatepunaea meridiana]
MFRIIFLLLFLVSFIGCEDTSSTAPYIWSLRFNITHEVGLWVSDPKAGIHSLVVLQNKAFCTNSTGGMYVVNVSGIPRVENVITEEIGEVHYLDTDGSNVYYVDSHWKTVNRLSINSEITGSTTLPRQPYAIGVSDSLVVVGCQWAIVLFDKELTLIKTVPLVGRASAVTFDNDRIFCTYNHNHETCGVVVLSSTGEFISRFEQPTYHCGIDDIVIVGDDVLLARQYAGVQIIKFDGNSFTDLGNFSRYSLRVHAHRLHIENDYIIVLDSSRPDGIFFFDSIENLKQGILEGAFPSNRMIEAFGFLTDSTFCACDFGRFMVVGINEL